MSQRRIWIGLRLRTFTGWHLSSVKTLLSIYVLSAVTELRCRPVVSCFAKWYFQIVNWISVWIRTFFDHLSRSVFIPIILFVGLFSFVYDRFSILNGFSYVTGFRLWPNFILRTDFLCSMTGFSSITGLRLCTNFILWPDFVYDRIFVCDRISPLTGFRLWPDFTCHFA